MRRAIAPIALAVGVLVLETPAGAMRSEATTSMTIRLLSKSGPSIVLRDRPPRGVPSKGDVVAASSVLRNQVRQFGAPKGTVVGGDYAVATLLSAHLASVKVRVTLPGGTLRVVAGRETDRQNSGTESVVAGTGRFAGARGMGYWRELNRRERRAINVYHLHLP